MHCMMQGRSLSQGYAYDTWTVEPIKRGKQIINDMATSNPDDSSLSPSAIHDMDPKFGLVFVMVQIMEHTTAY